MAVPAVYGPLTEGETKLIDAFGTSADLDLNSERRPQSATPAVAVRAELLRWLLAHGEPEASGRAPGLRLAGAFVQGALDLAGFRVDFPLILHRCTLGAIDLNDASLVTLDLSGSHCEGIEADRVKVERGLLLGNGFNSSRQVYARNATIGGDLYCDGGTFTRLEDADGWAFLFDGARIDGRMFMRGATLEGPLQGFSARVDGGLTCSNGKFRNGFHGSVRLARIRVGGRVTFKDAEVEGRLDLSHASVGGQLDLSGLECTKAPSSGSVRLDGLSVAGAFAAEALSARGPVHFRAGSVGGELDCSRADLNGNGAGERALELAGTTVGGRLLMRCLKATGGVGVTGASIALDLTADGCAINGGSREGLELNRARVGGNLELRGQIEGRPALDVTSATVDGDVDLRDAALRTDRMPPSGREHPTAVTGEGLAVGATLLADGLHANGDVRFPRATVAGDVKMNAIEVSHRVVIGSSRIGGRLIFEKARFTGSGSDCGLSFVSGVVGAKLEWLPALFPDGGVVDLRHAHVDYLVDSRSSWPLNMDLRLTGFSYSDVGSSMTIKQRLAWVRRATQSSIAAYSPQPYEQLMATLRESGDSAGARRIGRAKEQDARPTLGPLGKVVNSLLGFSLGHGYQLWRVLLIAGGVIGLGWLIFALADCSNQMHDVRKPDAYEPTFQAFTYSLDSFLPVVNLHQEEYRLPSGFPSLYLTVHIVAGWGLTTLLAFGLTGLAKRD